MYIYLKCTKFLKINAGHSLNECLKMGNLVPCVGCVEYRFILILLLFLTFHFVNCINLHNIVSVIFLLI